MENFQNMQSGRTYPEHSVQIKEKISSPYWKNLSESKSQPFLFLNLQNQNGAKQGGIR